MGILKLLLYILLIVFPLGVIPRINVITSAYVYPLDIVLFLVFTCFLFHVLKKKIKVYNLPVFKQLYIFIFFSLFSLILNIKYLNLESFLVSFLYIIRFILYANMLFAFSLLGRKFAKKYLFFLSISGFVAVFFGIFQYIFYPDLRGLYYLGWDKHFYRIFSTFLDPNFAGPIFVLELILLLGILATNFEVKKKKNMLLFSGIFLSFIAVFYTYSRSTFVMFVVSLLTFVWQVGKKKFIILVFVALVLGILMIPKDIKSEGVVLLRTASIISREGSYKNALTIFKDAPIVGIGFNAYRYAQKRYNFSDLRNWETTHPGAGVSNSLLFVLVTTGIIGFVLYLNFLLSLIKNILKLKNESISIYMQAVVLSSITGILSHSLFENSLFYPFTMFWVFTIAGSFLVYKDSP